MLLVQNREAHENIVWINLVMLSIILSTICAAIAWMVLALAKREVHISIKTFVFALVLLESFVLIMGEISSQIWSGTQNSLGLEQTSFIGEILYEDPGQAWTVINKNYGSLKHPLFPDKLSEQEIIEWSHQVKGPKEKVDLRIYANSIQPWWKRILSLEVRGAEAICKRWLFWPIVDGWK